MSSSAASASAGDKASASADSKSQAKGNKLKGKKIRDEFLCPITYELMREPYVGSDGHTYERIAIEKWLRTKHTSPRSGEEMTTHLIPNHNLRKLIDDIILEVSPRDAKRLWE